MAADSDFVVTALGRVGIGTTAPTQKLTVDGKINAEEVIVQAGISDYVFEDDYQLMSIWDVDKFIKENKHLPGVTPATDLGNKEAVPIGERYTQLLEKIEELMLYTIQQQGEIDYLKSLIK